MKEAVVRLATRLKKLPQTTRQPRLLASFALLALSLLTPMAVEAQTQIVADQCRFFEALLIILTYVEGAFGALVMVAAGIGSILGAAFGQYRASLSLLVVSVGSFILRSLIETFFDLDTARAQCNLGA